MKIKKASTLCIMMTLIVSMAIIGVHHNVVTAEDESQSTAFYQFVSNNNEGPRTRGGLDIQSEEERQTLLQEGENGLQRFSLSENAHGGAYHFSRSFSSWVGFGQETTFWIEDGEVVRRYYETWDSEGEIRSYNETGDEVGSHSSGSHPQTMYDLYEECNGLLQSDLVQYEIWFESDEHGVITSCGRYPYGCMDDCSDSAAAIDFSFD